MDRTTISLIVGFFVLLVIGMFSYAYLKKAELAEEVVQVVEEPEPEVPYANVTRIDAKHYFVDGTHTLVGEVTLPTPCDLLEVQAEIAERYPELVTLDFSVLNSTENCVQQMTTQRFQVSFQASEEAEIADRARFAGREVELNLIPALPGETPQEFEVFNKG